MIRKISAILVFWLFLLSATGILITDGKESSKIHIHQNNIIENTGSLGPNLSYYPESHDFGYMNEGEVDNTTFEIWNTGCCKLRYWLVENCSWVDVHPTNGSSTDEHDTIFVDINTTGLVLGPHICNISILCTAEENGVFTVTVNILDEGFTNITIYEAWVLLNDTSNGVQTPIDVRTDVEWENEHIDTPYPEKPKHHCLSYLNNETKLQEFMLLYNGKEIILYCKSGSRSRTAAQILVDNEFNGTIYNMLGGIIAWKEAGFPTTSDQPPSVEIVNPQKGYFHFSGIPLLPRSLNLIADTISLGGFRLRPIIINATDDVDNSEDLIVKVYLNGDEQGNASYCCDWRLHEWFWTGRTFGIYQLKVTAEDAIGQIGSAEMKVWNFCFIP